MYWLGSLAAATLLMAALMWTLARWWLGWAFVVFCVVLMADTTELMGTSRPFWTHLQSLRGSIIQSFVLDEGHAIYLWLVPNGSHQPTSWRFPWDRKLAQELIEAKQKADKAGTQVSMGPPWEGAPPGGAPAEGGDIMPYPCRGSRCRPSRARSESWQQTVVKIPLEGQYNPFGFCRRRRAVYGGHLERATARTSLDTTALPRPDDQRLGLSHQPPLPRPPPAAVGRSAGSANVRRSACEFQSSSGAGLLCRCRGCVGLAQSIRGCPETSYRSLSGQPERDPRVSVDCWSGLAVRQHQRPLTQLGEDRGRGRGA
jgi:hypothetical protein